MRPPPLVSGIVTLRRQVFDFETSYEESFGAYFSCLRRAGVEVVTASEDSVVRDAGARFVPLSELLAHPGGGL